MEYLQYERAREILADGNFVSVLNLIINGIPSILVKT